MKRKQQPRFSSRQKAIDAILQVRAEMPATCLRHVSDYNLRQWHIILNRAIATLKPLGVTDDVQFAPRLKLRIKDELRQRRADQVQASLVAITGK